MHPILQGEVRASFDEQLNGGKGTRTDRLMKRRCVGVKARGFRKTIGIDTKLEEKRNPLQLAVESGDGERD